MHLQVLDNFKDLFLNNVALFFKCKTLVEFLTTDNIIGFPNAILHGSDEMVLNLCTNIILRNVSQTSAMVQKREPDKVHQFPHYWHMHFLVVDMADLLYQQKVSLLTFLKRMSSNVSINPITKKHIVVLKNFDKVSFNMMPRFKNVIDGADIFFLLVGKNISNIDKSITSRCFCLRCVVNVFESYECILEHLDIHLDQSTTDLYLKKSRGNLTKFLLMLENKKTSFVFEEFLNSRINKMLSFRQDKDLLACITDTVSRLEISGVRPEATCQQIIDICANKNADIHSVVSLMANSQLKFMVSNKHSFIYEEMFLKLVNIIL